MKRFDLEKLEDKLLNIKEYSIGTKSPVSREKEIKIVNQRPLGIDDPLFAPFEEEKSEPRHAEKQKRYQTNSEEIAKLKAKALSTHDGDLAYQIGEMYEQGKCVAEDMKMAMGWYLLALQFENDEANNKITEFVQYALNDVPSDGDDEGGYGDYEDDNEENEESEENYDMREDDESDTSDQDILYHVFEDDANPVQMKENGELLKKLFHAFAAGISVGDVECMEKVGVAYLEGSFFTQDDKKAVFWLETAIENGSEYAYYPMGVCYLTGKGVKKDVKKGLLYLQKASQYGIEEAKELLKALAE